MPGAATSWNGLTSYFKEMFIDRHPAYPLYRHWADLTDKSPEFPAPPTDDPTPRISEDEPVESTDYLRSRYADSDGVPRQAPAAVLRLPSRRIMALVRVVLALVALAFGVLSRRSGRKPIPNIIQGVAVTWWIHLLWSPEQRWPWQEPEKANYRLMRPLCLAVGLRRRQGRSALSRRRW